MQPARISHDLLAGLQVQVVGVGQHHLGPRIAQLGCGDTLHRGQGANGHEARRGDRAMGGLEAAAACPGAGASGGDVE